jgi:biopolymer transport protein ExbB/TolQ
MKKLFFILTLFVTILFAKNPQVYAALGDVIYNNVQNIEKLQEIEKFQSIQTEIEVYLQKVKQVKQDGFALEQGDKSVDKKNYLNHLRSLSKRNDYFVHAAREAFRNSMKQEDSKTFEKIINTGLINTEKYQEKILAYYMQHQDDVNATGVIQDYLDKEAKEKKLQRKYYKSKKQLEAEKIRRIREADKIKQAELEKKLDEEVKQKKENIRKEQERSLFH